MFVCARGENIGFAKEIGIGIVESSIELTALILRENPKFLIFLGSAGAYSKEIALMDIFVSNSATQIESSFAKGESYTPLDNKIEIVSYETLQNQNADFGTKLNTILDSTKSRAIVNSSNYICTDEIFAEKMTRAGIMLENMEFFAILKTADYFKIPALGIFCVTNYCDKNAHSDFLANHKEAQKLLESNARAIQDALHKGTFGGIYDKKYL